MYWLADVLARFRLITRLWEGECSCFASLEWSLWYHFNKMVVVVGPAFSLAASGYLGGCILYTAARWFNYVRMKKRYYKPTYVNWGANSVLFGNAVKRWSRLNKWHKKAWKAIPANICWSPRDKFVSAQIKAWMEDPNDDLLWVPGPVPSVDGIEAGAYFLYDVGGVKWFKVVPWAMYGVHHYKYIIAHVYYIKEDDASVPTTADLWEINDTYFSEMRARVGKKSYFWIGYLRTNGTISNKSMVFSIQN